MKKLLATLMVVMSTPTFAQGFSTFTKYEGDCVKKDIVESAFLKKIPKTENVYDVSNITVLKHPDVETYLELIFAPDGCFIGTNEINQTQFDLMRNGV